MEIRKCPPSTLRNIDGGPLKGGAGGLTTPTTNTKKYRRHTPWEAVPEVQERPPSTLRNIDSGPPGPHGGAVPIRAMTEVQERPPSTLRNIDSEPPDPHEGSGHHPINDKGPVASTINAKKHRQWTPWEAVSEV
jgi:hypothetical protein